MKILIVTDAWHPQINGVVRTLEATARELEHRGHAVRIAGPDAQRPFCIPMPGYPEILLEFFAGSRLARLLDRFRPDLIHLATEGPLGWSMRRLCRKRAIPFTTAFHSRFPEYCEARAPAGLKKALHTLAYTCLRHFHAPSQAVMVATRSMEDELRRQGFHNLVRWHRGVDTDLFRLYDKDFPFYEVLPRPILLYVGRVAREKNLPAFLELKTEGSKVVIGEGPDLVSLKALYPETSFFGSLEGTALAHAYAAADLFVFPSTTDTFGLVLLEAAAAGLRIAACPAPGPVDLFSNDQAQAFAALDWNLQTAVDKALALPDDPIMPRAFADNHSWSTSTQEFLKILEGSLVRHPTI